MPQVPIFPIKSSRFHFHATPVTVEVGDTPALGMAVPLNGKTDVRLEVTPILLVSGDGTPELLNAAAVTRELKQRGGQVASFIAYEVSCDNLPAGGERFFEYFYRKIEPCYLFPQKHVETCKQRLIAIFTLMEDQLLQQFIKEEVLPGADPLMPSALRLLFNNRLSKSTFEKDLKKIRQEKAHQGTAPEPSPPSAAPPNYPVQPDDATHPSHDGASASLDSILCANEGAHCTRRYASHGKRREIEHAKQKSSQAFGASRLHRRIGRDPGTLLRESLGINTGKP